MPRDNRRSYSRSPRRSRSGSYDRRSNDIVNNNNGNNGYDRRGGGGGGGGGFDRREDRHYSDRDRDRRERSRSRNRSRSRSPNDEDMCRVHVADLTDSVSQHEIEKVFKKYGELKEVWLAKNPPCFAFVVFKNPKEAALAVKEMDQRTIGNSRVKVTFARPRTKGRRRRWDPNMRCYQCGQRGHFSRDCNSGRSFRRRSYSRDRYRYRSRTRSRSRRSRSYSRSRTPPRRDRYETSGNNQMN